MTTPTLHEDRIDQMRSTVMLAVDDDIKRRGSRVRTTIGLAAASVLVVGFGGYAISSIDAGGGDDSAASDSVGTSYESSDGVSALQDSAADESAGKSSSDLSAQEDAAPDADRQVITTGYISVTVTQPRQTAAKVSAYVEGLGGRVDSRAEDGDGQNASASLQVRVPATKVTATIEQLKTYGTVDNVSLQNDDVTATSRDLTARIDALELSIDRLQDILNEADTSNEVIKAENALTERQEQLESLQSQKRTLDGQVELSTLSIELSQKPRVDSVEPGGFTGGLRDGWNAMVSTVNKVVEVAGAVLPWAALAGVLFVGYRLVARRKHWN